jgi:hypothetical protein
MKKIYVQEFEHYVKPMPYSEAMMHMKLSGMKCRISFQGASVKVYPDIDKGNYVTVTPSEAGLYYDNEENKYYFHSED